MEKLTNSSEEFPTKYTKYEEIVLDHDQSLPYLLTSEL